LADFQEHLERFEELDTSVCALSVDGEEEAQKTVSRHRLEYSVCWGLDGEEVAAKTGAYRDTERGHLQATSFILRDGTVMHATYSSGPLGRLQAEHAVGFIEYAEKQG
jgi:peroxiredoxin